MSRQVSVWAFSLGLVMAACSGRVDVGIEPGDGGSGGSGAPLGTAGSAPMAGSGALPGTAGSAPVAGSGAAGSEDDGTPNTCSFSPLQAADSRPLLPPGDVSTRIFQFLDNDPGPQGGAAPEPTPDWAAGLAKTILDQHEASGTPALGLARFLEHWLQVAPDELEAPSTWALKLVARDATLSTLLAEPSGEPHRLGILNEAEVLTLRPSITARGSLISASLLCQPIPAPPPTLAHPVDLAPSDTLTRREEHDQSAKAQPVCAACHQLADAGGYSLEHFDEIGDYRDVDNGKPVDASGTLNSLSVSFNDYADLAPQFVTSCEVAHCFSTLLGREAFGAELWSDPGPLSEAEINLIARDFVASGYSIRALVDAIVRSPSFLR